MHRGRGRVGRPPKVNLSIVELDPDMGVVAIENDLALAVVPAATLKATHDTRGDTGGAQQDRVGRREKLAVTGPVTE